MAEMNIDIVEALKESRKVFTELQGILANIVDEPGDFEDRFKELINKLDNYIYKLENNIIEIAFAGVEKAGKSSFVNAFIGKDILPTAQERATYTTTEIRYGEKGKVVIEFYSEEEFLKEVLHKMLEKVDYRDYERISLNTINKELLEAHEKLIENKIRENSEIRRTLEDLKEIVEGRKEIQRLLTGKVEERPLDSRGFRTFITHKHKSRAVKKITIYSPQLEDMKNVVIYDLPGFDSPTYIHSRYTKESLKKADAIVFIRLADKPSLTGPEVEIIENVYEDDGIPIKEKMFFFANKADLFYTREDYINARRKLIEELKRRGLYTVEDRIIFGSAKAHMERGEALERLKKLNLDTGIEEVRKKIVRYNETERAKILKRRIINVLIGIDNLLEELLDSIEISSVPEIPYAYLEIFEKSREKLLNNLDRYINEFKTRYPDSGSIDNKPISSRLKEILAGVIKNIREEEIEEIKEQIKAGDYTPEERPDKFNLHVREKISANIRENLHSRTRVFLEETLQRFRKEIVDLFLESLEVSEENRKTMESEIKKFIEDIVHLSENKEISGIQMLVDRFSGDVRETLMIPLNTSDRKNKFKVSKKDIFSTMIFHDSFDDIENMQNVATIIEEVFLNQYPLYEIRQGSLKTTIKNILGELNLNIRLDDKMTSVIIDLIMRKVLPLSEVKEILKEHRKFIDDFDSLKNVLLNSPSNNRKRPETYEEVLQEIDRDIENLRSIVESAVINAINVEKALKVYITDMVNLIKEAIKKDKFMEFFHRNMRRISNLGEVITEIEIKRKKYEEKKRYRGKLNELRERVQKSIKVMETKEV